MTKCFTCANQMKCVGWVGCAWGLYRRGVPSNSSDPGHMPSGANACGGVNSMHMYATCACWGSTLADLQCLTNVSVESMVSKCFTILLAHAKTKMENPWADHSDTNTNASEVAQKNRHGRCGTASSTSRAISRWQGCWRSHYDAYQEGFHSGRLGQTQKNGTITYELV